jgi:glyoxylate/hydroxypyruvate/2-ketogluconate reductase
MSKPKVLVARRLFADVIAPLRERFELDMHDSDTPLPPAELAARLQGCWGLLGSGTERVDAQLLAACPDLRAVALMTVGYNNLDVPACRARGLRLSNAPGVLTEATADFGLALLLAAARRVGESERYLRAGQWNGWQIDQFAGQELRGSMLGIIGMGRIGGAIAHRAHHGFGMQIRYCNRSAAANEAAVQAQRLALPELLAQADHVIVVVPYSPDTHHLIGAAELALMKPTATFVNIARGGVVHDGALAAALQGGRLAAAGLDVFEGEPAVHPALLACHNAVLTPHIASSTLPTRRAMVGLAVQNLLAWAQGEAGPTPI